MIEQWSALLLSRDLLANDGNGFSLTSKTDGIMRQMLGAQLREVLKEFACLNGILQFSTSQVLEEE